MPHENKTKKYPVDTICMNASYLLPRFKFHLGKDTISAFLQDFLPHPKTPQPPTINTPPKKQKLTKKMLSVIPSSIFHTQFTVFELKSKQEFHSNGNRAGTASVEVLN